MVFIASRECESWPAPISEERMFNVFEATVLIEIRENETGRNTNMEKITRQRQS